MRIVRFVDLCLLLFYLVQSQGRSRNRALTSSSSEDEAAVAGLHALHALIVDKKARQDGDCLYKSSDEVYTLFEKSDELVTDEHGVKWPVLIQTPCITSHALGNFIGTYLEVRLCAESARMHYLSYFHTGVERLVDSGKGGESPDVLGLSNSSHNDYDAAFSSSFPNFVFHTNASKSIDEARTNMETLCLCREYCWSRPFSLIHSRFERARVILREGLDAYSSKGNISKETMVVESVNFGVSISEAPSLEQRSQLPFLPDVSIQFRCSDMVHLLPYRYYTELIPSNATISHIYIMSEVASSSLNRGKSMGTRPKQIYRCGVLVKILANYLRFSYPNASVAVLRGNNIYHDFFRMAKAPYLFCSVSTFCLWPAITRKNVGHAFLPVHRELFGEINKLLIGPSFTWIDAKDLVEWEFISHKLESQERVCESCIVKQVLAGIGREDEFRTTYYVTDDILTS